MKIWLLQTAKDAKWKQDNPLHSGVCSACRQDKQCAADKWVNQKELGYGK